MRTGFIALLVGILLSASAAPGQAPNQVPNQGPNPAPLPAPLAAAPAAPSETFLESQPVMGFAGIPRGPGMWTASVDYLLWVFLNDERSFDAAATSFPRLTTLATLGDERLNEIYSGARFGIGYWHTEENAYCTQTIRSAGVEVRGFFLGEQSVHGSVDLLPDVVRPFLDLNNGQLAGVIVAAPGLATGAIEATATANLWGAELNVWKHIYHDPFVYSTVSVDVMAGLRYLGINQEIQIHRVSNFFPDLTDFPEFAGFENNKIEEREVFGTHNRFYGGQIGVCNNLLMGELTLSACFKLALGTTRESLTIQGVQARTLADKTTTTSPGALLALPSNIGTYQRNQFTQVPEINLKLAWPILDHITLSLGADFLYWSRILRPGDQIDRGIDITQIPNYPPGATAIPTGFQRPGVPLAQSSLWVLGATFGLEFTW